MGFSGNPGSPVTLPWLRATSDALIHRRSVRNLWLSHSYPKPHLHLEKKDYFAHWQPYCLPQLTLGSHILNNYQLTSPAHVNLKRIGEGFLPGFLSRLSFLLQGVSDQVVKEEIY